MKNICVAGLVALIQFLLLSAWAVSSPAKEKVVLFYFWGEGCPHCARAKPFLEDLKKRNPTLDVRSLEVFSKSENLELLKKMARQHGTEARSVPMMFIGNRFFAGFSEETARNIEAEVKRATGGETIGSGDGFRSSVAPQLKLPFVGTIDTAGISLPVFTLIIAGLDSFNPCAFFVLFFLLSLLVHAHSRQRMLIIGGIFVVVSALIYFLYMAAWLNFFLLFGGMDVITLIAGMVAFVIATINIKDFFFFKRGISLVIPDQAKPRLFERMRNLVHTGSLSGMVVATIILALAANTYEVVCTAGFPMVYTRTLTLQGLSVAMYYLYLVLYNIVYVIPLGCIVAVFVITLGSRRLSEWQGRILKLLSGTMMLGLAIILVTRPSLLNNAIISVGLLLATLTVTCIIVVVAKHFGLDTIHHQPD